MFELKLIFDSQEDVEYFIAGWLDGGGEQTSGFITNYEQSDMWNKHTAKWLKLERGEEIEE